MVVVVVRRLRGWAYRKRGVRSCIRLERWVSFVNGVFGVSVVLMYESLGVEGHGWVCGFYCLMGVLFMGILHGITKTSGRSHLPLLTSFMAPVNMQIF